MFSLKAVEIPEWMQLSIPETEVDEGVGRRLSDNAGFPPGSDSPFEGTKKMSNVDYFPEDFRKKENYFGQDFGVNRGKRAFFEDTCASSTTKTACYPAYSTSSVYMAKRSRVYHSSQNPRCQVEGCNLDLKSAKDYHRRHKICESHSKSPKVTVAGVERRFCQQCSRFHELSEFDDDKRSCRRRLSDHNARRRRPKLEPTQFNFARPCSLSYDGMQQMNLLTNRVSSPFSDPIWRSACSNEVTQVTEISPAKGRSFDKRPHHSSDEMPNAISTLYLESNSFLSLQSTTTRLLNHDVEPSGITPNLNCEPPHLPSALSLLSASCWASKQRQPTYLDQLMHVNHVCMAPPPMYEEPGNTTVASSEYVTREQEPSPDSLSLDLHATGISQFQEFHLFDQIN